MGTGSGGGTRPGGDFRPPASGRHWPDRRAHRHRKRAHRVFLAIAVLLVVLPWFGYRHVRDLWRDTPAASPTTGAPVSHAPAATPLVPPVDDVPRTQAAPAPDAPPPPRPDARIAPPPVDPTHVVPLPAPRGRVSAADAEAADDAASQRRRNAESMRILEASTPEFEPGGGPPP